jgi:hypothetical protein
LKKKKKRERKKVSERVCIYQNRPLSNISKETRACSKGYSVNR